VKNSLASVSDLSAKTFGNSHLRRIWL